MHTFSKTKNPANPHDHIDATISTDSEELEKVLEAFEGYLRASGFSLAYKHIEVVENE